MINGGYLYFISQMDLIIGLLMALIHQCSAERCQRFRDTSDESRNVTVCSEEVSPGVSKYTSFRNDVELWNVVLEHGYPTHIPPAFNNCMGLAHVIVTGDRFVSEPPYVKIPDPAEIYGRFLTYVYNYWDIPLLDIAFIYDDYGQDIMVSVAKSLSNVSAVYVHLEPESDISDKIVEMLTLTDTRNFMVATSTNTTNDIFKEIFNRNLDVLSNVWFILDLDNAEYSCKKCSAANIFFLRQSWRQNINILVLSAIDILHSECPLVSSTTPHFKRVVAQRSLVSGNFYFNVKKISKLLSNVTSSTPETGISTECCGNETCFNSTRATSASFKTSFMEIHQQLYKMEVCEIHSNGSGLKKHLEWSRHNDTKNDFSLLRIPERDTILRLVALHELPFVYLSKNNGTTTYSGYMIDVIQHIFRESGLKYVLHECNGGLYGDLNEETGQWSGCVSDVAYGRADLIVTVLSVTSKRMTVVDYIQPYFGHSGIQILGQSHSKQAFFFLEVLTPSLWVTICGTVLLSSFVLCLQERVIYSKRKKNKNLKTYISKFSDSAWFSVSSLVFSGNHETPKSHTAKILVAGFWGFCAFLMSAFTANMAAFLTVYRLDHQTLSVPGLATQNNVNFSFPKDSSISNYFYKMMRIEEDFQRIWTQLNLYTNKTYYEETPVWNNPIPLTYSRIWKRAVETNAFVSSTSVALKEVRKGKSVYLTDTVVAKYLSDVNCDLEPKGSDVNGRPYSFAIRKNSRYKDIISKTFLELKQRSLMVTMKETWWKKLDNCSDDWNKGFSLSEASGYLYVVCVGLATAVVALLIENIVFRTKNKASKNLKQEHPEESQVEGMTFTSLAE